MALNLATPLIETEDAPAILGGGAIPAAPLARVALPSVQLDTSVGAPAVLGSAAAAPAPSSSTTLAPVSILGSAAPAAPLAVTSPGPLVDPALIASAQAALARTRGPQSVPETTVEGTPPLPGLAGKAIAAPLAAQGGAAFDEAIKGATKGAKAAVAAYNAANPLERLSKLQAQQAGERAAQLTGYRGNLANAYDTQRAGMQMATEGAVQSAEELAKSARANKMRAAAYADEAETNLDAAKAAKDEAADTRRRADQEFADAKIDLDKAYGDSGQRLMSAVSIALGAFGSSLTGGPNFAMQLVNDRINRVIDAQKAEIEKKKTQASNAAQLFRDMVNVYGDERTATEAYRAKLLDSTIAYAKAKYAPALEQGKGLETIGRLEAERDSALQNVDTQISQNAQLKAMIPVQAKASTYVAGQAAAAGLAKEKRAHEFELEKIRAKGEEDRATEMAKTITAGEGPKAEAEGSKAFQDAMKGQGVQNPVEAENALQTALKTLDTHGAEFDSIAKRASLKFPEWVQGPAGKEYVQDLTRAYLSYRKAVTGSGGGEKEMEEIRTATGGFNPDLMRRFITEQMNILATQKQHALATVPATVRDRVAELHGVNQSVQPGTLPASFKAR